VGIDLEDGGAEALEDAIDELGEDRALVPEVEVESPFGDLRRRDDVVDLGVGEALGREDVARGVKERESALGFVHDGVLSQPPSSPAPASPRTPAPFLIPRRTPDSPNRLTSQSVRGRGQADQRRREVEWLGKTRSCWASTSARRR